MIFKKRILPYFYATIAYAAVGVIATFLTAFLDMEEGQSFQSWAEFHASDNYPVTIDFVFWIILTLALGFMGFFTIERFDPDRTMATWAKTLISTLLIPVFLAVVLLVFAGILSLATDSVPNATP